VPALWDAKHGSLDEPVTCYAISAKRYVLYREREGRIDFERVVDRHDDVVSTDESEGTSDQPTPLEDWSEHGLGLYLDPRNPDDPLRDEHRRRIWMREAWEWIVQDDPLAPMPEWAARPALTRFTVSSPTLRDWFSGYDDSVPRHERIRPGAFGLLGHPVGLVSGVSPEARPARGYERDPARWEQGSWYDRRTGGKTAITTLSPGDDPERFSAALASGAVKVQTLGEVLARHRLHPEHKSLAPDGRWAGEATRGLLRRRPISSAPVLTDLTGKEGNKIIERLSGEVEDTDEYRTDYGARADRWRALVVPVLRQMRDDLGTRSLSERIGVHRRSLERVLSPRAALPHSTMRSHYLDAVSEWCSLPLRQAGRLPGQDRIGVVWCYQQHVAPNLIRTCRVCGRPLRHPLARYCGQTCRKRAYRRRQASGARDD
jgi:hypothetical protein